MKIKSITYNSEPIEVFDIEVEENHNFIVENVVVHNCHTYKIANYLKKNIRSKRILTHNSDNRDEILAKHISSKEPTVLLTPSMTEGVDLIY